MRCDGLFLPSWNVHAHHKEPQAQRYFCDSCSHKIGEDAGLQPRRKKERETVDEVAQALDRQQHAYESGKEGRPKNQIYEREAIESKKYQADGKAMFKQLDRYVRRSL